MTPRLLLEPEAEAEFLEAARVIADFRLHRIAG
jgi:hypothetical protein